MAPVLKLEPGLYLMRARAFGLKGRIGFGGLGDHSYLAVVTDRGHKVAEVTDSVTLERQHAAQLWPVEEWYGEAQRRLIVSNRDPGQLWFGAKPRVWAQAQVKGDLELLFKQIVNSYPWPDVKFDLLRRNCNTFTSWAAHQLHLPTLNAVGAKSNEFWRRLEV